MKTKIAHTQWTELIQLCKLFRNTPCDVCEDLPYCSKNKRTQYSAWPDKLQIFRDSVEYLFVPGTYSRKLVEAFVDLQEAQKELDDAKKRFEEFSKYVEIGEETDEKESS